MNLSFFVSKKPDETKICEYGRALSRPERIQILRTLQVRPLNLIEIAKALGLSASSVSFHVDALEKAGIIRCEYQPTLKGHMKLCSINVTSALFRFEREDPNQKMEEVSSEVAVGDYVDCDFEQGYLVSNKGFIFRDVSTAALLFTPERANGQLFSIMNYGKVSYNFPNLYKQHSNHDALLLSFECCSEAPFYRNEWPSDITVWINGVEIFTFLSPGDFGGRRGKFTPKFWNTNSTQFGLLRTIGVNKMGSFLDSQLINKDITLASLDLDKRFYIQVTIGIKEDAEHKGGINLFGKNFGDYAQDIKLTLFKSS